MAVQLLLFYYVLFPLLGLKITPVSVSVLVFGLNSGAYISEIMRSGIQSVDPGQMEAGRAVGLSFPVTMIKIVIPQAVKNILPTLGNEFIALIKETSIIGYAGALDLVYAFKQIGTSSYEYTVPYIVLSVIYIVLVVFITILLKIMERWLAKSDRRR
jgi:polar amino acid transport system permease protein